MGFREAYANAGAVVLEPIMKLETQAPEEFQGSVMGQINQRRGMIANSTTSTRWRMAATTRGHAATGTSD